MAFTIENIASAPRITDLSLSPDGSKIVYQVAPTLKTGQHPTASLWYSSDTTESDSAKQLTSGLFDDSSPAWHPNSTIIFFLSDRHKAGGPKQIYEYSLDGPGEPHLVNDRFKDNKNKVEQFRVSPDGNYIAFVSADEPSSEDETKTKEKDDAHVFGETKANVRVKLYTISTGEVRTLAHDHRHTVSFTWSPDSKSLIYLLAERSDMEARYEPLQLFLISILPTPKPELRHLANFKRAPAVGPIWPSSSHLDLYTIESYDLNNIVDASSVHHYFPHSLSLAKVNSTDIGDGFPLVNQSVNEELFYTGKEEDANFLTDLRSEDGEFVVGVAAGMDTRLDVLNSSGKVFTLYSTESLAGFRSFDIKKSGDEYVLACARSSGPEKAAPDVWIGRIKGKQRVSLTTKLSSHYSWIEKNNLGPVQVFEWLGEDGVPLQGMAWFPSGADPANVEKPLPTILHIHGGPYARDVPELNPFFLSWQHIMAERGYLVLTPNYRGSSGRGHAFARAAYCGVGTSDWTDVNAMVDTAVKRGLADQNKLGIGGWSQGGFLTAWGVSQTKNKFKCGIMGAGVSDWGSETTESDLPDFEADLGGTAPWVGKSARLEGDPIRFVKDVETAMLILHGEDDVRVPVVQGIGYHRGLRRLSKYPDRHTLVTYPREGHLFTERKHGEDLMRRVIEHYDAWLK